MSDGQYYEGYVSVFDSTSDVSLDVYNSSNFLLNSIQDEWGVQRLQWFTKGLYSVTQEKQKIVLTDLRMGAECGYVFNFIVGEQTDTGIVASDYEKFSVRPDLSQISKIWDRIWDSSISLAPAKKNAVCATSKEWMYRSKIVGGDDIHYLLKTNIAQSKCLALHNIYYA